ncbi:sarcosine oxidase subunit gamma family protein [Pseudosulfitobacter sp. DSM 107133]|uniref:sarcosine oxidase subunit gamma n=1 Tax=Pseudosulfitobacter sp. DSM 107133 TaxID=2883100 RepID=UPI000DF34025|nr:sarcosine oxidase subunit gamma family protein [Pseudosulfitobacter sp. DSM 107133]UOA26768.1 Sarcosine oxidase subunit gamma [Pseudosulfitobacter sp. DSM 107133]
MSNIVSALNQATYTGGIAEVREIGLQGMITLRGDMSSAAVKSAATGVAGVDMPAPNHANCVGQRGICWMSPDELLVLCPYETVADSLVKMRKSLAKAHALKVDVSDARAVFDLSGPNAREVLAKLVPVDLSPAAFKEGMFRRSRMAQIPAAFWLHAPDTFRIITFRSNAQYAFDLLKVAAQPGSEVGYF